MSRPLAGKVCLVTGGTRGIGRGIAVQLGQAGATVYVTGRTLRSSETDVGGSLEDTAKEIEGRGGRCIPVVCDHSQDYQIEALFKQIELEQDGQLDILVNNAYSAVKAIADYAGTPFWEQKVSMWDQVNQVGLRNHYLCTVYAAKMMTKKKTGLIANVSSPGGLTYFINVPYGIGKQANDRMAADCGVELKKYNVAMVSLWPGVVQTELLLDGINNKRFEQKDFYQPGVGKMTSDMMAERIKQGESPEFTGIALVKLARDRNIMKKSGKILIVAELAEEYGFSDIDGRKIPSIRSVKHMLQMSGRTWMAKCVPGWIKVPYFGLTLAGSKF